MHPRSSHRDTDTSRQSSPHQSALNKTHTRKSRVQGAICGDSARAFVSMDRLHKLVVWIGSLPQVGGSDWDRNRPTMAL
jgi:hypothetical protein